MTSHPGGAERLLEAEGLYKSFGGLMAVNGVDFSVGEGEVLGLIGPNGSGKTTLFNLISGVFRPDRGSIRFDGRELTRAAPAAICGMGVARTFQLTRPFPQLTVLDNVKLGRVYGSAPAGSLREAERDARELCDFIGLGPKAGLPAGRLGVIDRKRLELGKALATRPRLLLLDEIMAGLNPTEVQTAIGLLQRVREAGVTVIVIEHLMRAMLGMADRLLVLHLGEKIADGAPREVLRERRVIDAYLGTDHDALH